MMGCPALLEELVIAPKIEDKLTPELIHGFSEKFLVGQFDEPQPTPEFHMELWGLMCSDHPNVAIAAPRGHAKSTAVTHTFVLAAMLFRFRRFALIVSDTLGQSKEFLADIKRELEENEKLRTLFGISEFVIDNQETVVVKLVGTDLIPYEFRITCKGAEQSMRGTKWRNTRPDLIVCDDLENDEAVENEERRAKFRAWFRNALLPCGSKRCLVRVVGTVLHFDSLLYRLLPDPNDEKTVDTALKMYSTKENVPWMSVLYRAHPGPSDFSEILWPEMWSEERLRLKREDYYQDGYPEGYAREYLNNPLAVEAAFFRKDDILPLDPDTQGPWNYYIGIDLAISEKNKRAFTAMSVFAVNSNEQMQVVDVRRFRGDTLEIIDTIFELHMRWKPDVIFCEQENIARTMEPILFREMDTRKQFPVIEFIPVTQDKMARARPLQGRVRAQRVEFDTEKPWWPDLLTEMLQFPAGPYKDIIDSMSMIFLGLSDVYEADTPEDLMYTKLIHQKKQKKKNITMNMKRHSNLEMVVHQ
jgi:predicted phage terminase large subunit-like protein